MMGSVSGRGETLTAVRSTLRESFLASDAENHQILTLAAVLDDERKSNSNSTVVQTLFDIIRTEETRSNHSTSNHLTSKKAWKSFKELLKLRRNNASNPTRSAAQVSFSSIRRANSFGADAAPAEAIAVLSNGDRIQRSSSMRLSAALAAEREMRRLSSVEPARGESVRMSLMAMLEEPTEHQSGVQEEENRSDEDGEGGREEDPIHDEVIEEEEEKGVGGGALVVEMACCVCMVRHKGAAFIPCGHTFCRMCSRELWVQRKHCPLCNNFILEILDIF